MDYTVTSIELRRDTLANKRNLATASAVVLLHWILKLDGIPFFGNVEIGAHVVWLHAVMGAFVAYFGATYWLTYRRDKWDWETVTGLAVGDVKPLQDWRSTPVDDKPAPIGSRYIPPDLLTDDLLKEAMADTSSSPEATFEKLFQEVGISRLEKLKSKFPAALNESRRLFQQHKRIQRDHLRTSLVVNEILPSLLALAALVTAVSRAIAAW